MSTTAHEVYIIQNVHRMRAPETLKYCTNKKVSLAGCHHHHYMCM